MNFPPIFFIDLQSASLYAIYLNQKDHYDCDPCPHTHHTPGNHGGHQSKQICVVNEDHMLSSFIQKGTT